MRTFTLTGALLMLLLCPSFNIDAGAKTIYVSPSGTGDGSGESHPSGSLNNAVASLAPGDTVIFLDGVYHQTLSIDDKAGTEEKPVVLMALHPGEVLITADTVRTHAVYINHASRMIIDGIKAGNSLHHAWNIMNCSYLTLTRCAGFNAGYYQAIDGHAPVTYEDNCHVFSIAYSDHVLAEDIWAWGTGRYLFAYFQCTNSIVRRGVFRADMYDRAPHSGMNVYDCSGCIAENIIAFGTRFHLQSDYNSGDPWGLVQGGMVFDDHTFPADSNRILGCFDLDNGQWRTELPRSNPAIHVMSHWHGTFEDMVIWKNALDYGFVLSTDQAVGLPQRALIGSPSKIKQNTNPHVNNRYVDGVLTTQALWPWPNEELIKRDLGMDMTITVYVRGMVMPYLDIRDNQAEGAVTSIELTTGEITLHPGDSLQLTYSLLPQDAFYSGVKWSSGNPAIISVSSDGMITAHSEGVTLVSILSVDSGLSDTCEVIVENETSGTGNAKQDGAAIRAYPNPAMGTLIVEFAAGVKTSVRLINNMGKILMEKTSDIGTLEMETSGLSAGIYILAVRNREMSKQLIISVQ